MKIVNCKLKIIKVSRQEVYLFIILLIGAFLRFYGLNWDQGFSLHPDERAIVMFTIPLHFPSSFEEFLKPSSPLNPHFFAYGNFPIYFLKIASLLTSILNPAFSQYGGINLVGRFFSVLFDLSTILLLFLLGKKLFNKNVGIISAFFYSISVLAIQSSHFYIVDIPLTFFVLITLYTILKFYEKPEIKKAFLIGVFFGLSLATKTSASVLLIPIGIAMVIDFLLIFMKDSHKPHIWFPHVPKVIKKIFVFSFAISITTALIFFLFEPYTLIDFQNFQSQIKQQYQMTYNAYTFPYTLQYVGKIPYLYEIKNIFFWGLGPIITILSFLGTFYFIFIIFKKEKKNKWAQELILVIFFLAYFFTVGKFAIGFMRYLLPVYPLLCLFAAVFTYKILKSIKIKLNYFYLLVVLVFIGSILIWPLSFLSIYSKPNTRVLATNWINTNVSPSNTLAIEHWDDRIPLYESEKYNFAELTLYDQPDNEFKWNALNQKLANSDYIIIASNRLYIPLQKLDNCNKYKSCYPKTSQYYKRLFNEKLGFKKVAEFSSNPTIPILNIQINDQGADESFTVYDHPKIMIFKKQ